MNIKLLDEDYQNLLPLTYTRPSACLRIGILTIEEKWQLYCGGKTSHISRASLQKKFPDKIQDKFAIVNGSLLPTEELAQKIMQLKKGETIIQGDKVLAYMPENKDEKTWKIDKNKIINVDNAEIITDCLEMIYLNKQEIERDFKLITKGRKSQSLNTTNNIIGDANKIFVEEGAKINYATINTTSGVVYIGKDAEIMEGSFIRGTVSIGEKAVVKVGAKIYKNTSIGKSCKVGGEINHTIMQGYSNKAHDGYLGHSVIGEWCNLGADTNTSNLKNTYENVKMWFYLTERFKRSKHLFGGLIMGDHSKAGINTMFNTGTVVGVGSNIYGGGFPRNFVPSFAEGGYNGFKTVSPKIAGKIAERVMKRRNKTDEYIEIEKKIIENIFEETKKYRKFR